MDFTYEDILHAIDSGEQQEAYDMLQECNNRYYNDGTSSLTDSEFDDLQKRFETKYNVKIKTAPSLKKSGRRTDREANVPHEWPMMSGWLGKTASKEELRQWYIDIRDQVEDADLTVYASPKWDGMSVVISYDPLGNVTRALTRGEGGMGVDITRIFAGERHFSLNDGDADGPFGVKYELMMSWSDLERMNSVLKTAYKNPRNTVAGIAASDDAILRRPYITLAPIDIDIGLPLTREQRINTLSDLINGGQFLGNGDRITPVYWWEANDAETVENIYDEVYRLMTTEADDNVLDQFMIDGVVYEVASSDHIDALGGLNNDCPTYMTATKFPAMSGRTQVESIDFDLGPTGRRTPVVNFVPFTIGGRTFSRASMSNMTRFDALKLCVGTPLIVEIRGDVIAWPDRGGPDPDGAVPIQEPEGLTYTYDAETGNRVFAYSEAPLAGRCERMLIKMGVKGIREETLSKLVDAGLITSLKDCFSLNELDVASTPGLGELSARDICYSMEQKVASGLWDWEILASAGIPNIGRTLSKEAMKVVTLEDLIAGVWETEESRVGLALAVGPERAVAILNGVQEKLSDITDLMSVATVRHTRDAVVAATDGPKFKVVVTGDLKHWPDREAFKDYIEMLGHKMVGSISKKTDLLITNDPNSGTVKNRKAQELGVRIVTETEAIEVMGLDAPTASNAAVPVNVGVTVTTVDLNDL